MRFDEQLRLAGKAALVCGAGRGLGRSIAEGLAEAGADVVVASRNAAEIEALAAQLRRTGHGRALACRADVTRPEEVEAAVERVIAELGRIDILFNVAGGRMRKAVVETSDEEWDAMLRSNLSSAFYACRAAGRRFLSQRSGCVINVASTAGLRGRADRTAYCAAKAALINFSRALAVEWAPANIRVNVLCPGRFHTPATAAEHGDPDRYAKLLELSPLRRIASADEIKAAAVYLASPAAAYATGTVLVLDGGQTIT